MGPWSTAPPSGSSPIAAVPADPDAGPMDAPTEVTAPTGAQGPPPGPRQLRRRPDDGHIAGVCAGVAEYFNVDPVIVRIAAVVLLFSGPGAFAYVLAWIFVPAADGPAVHDGTRSPIDRKDRGTQVFGIVLIVLAMSVFWGDWWAPARHWLLPTGLMALGAWLLLRRDDDADETAVAPAPPPSTPMPPPAAWATGAGATDVTAQIPPTDDATTEAPATDLDDLADLDDDTALLPSDDDGAGGEPPTAPWDTLPPPPDPAPPAAPSGRSRRRMLGPIVFGALLIWAGVAFLADVTVETGLAGALLIIGIGFVLGAFVGGSRVLILPALFVGAALAVTAVVDIPLEGPVGQQRWTPAGLEDLADSYAVSIGEGTLDLQAVDVPAGDRVEVEASVGVGHLVVLVPVGMAVDVRTDVGAGESYVFGLRQNGVDVNAVQREPGVASSGTLFLDLEIGVGQIEVRRTFDFIPDSPTPPRWADAAPAAGPRARARARRR